MQFSKAGNEDLFKICINELNKYIKKIRTKYFFYFFTYYFFFFLSATWEEGALELKR